MLALRVLGVVEGLGLGLAHVRQAAIKAGLPEPRVRTVGDQTIATVWGNALSRRVAHLLENTSAGNRSQPGARAHAIIASVA